MTDRLAVLLTSLLAKEPKGRPQSAVQVYESVLPVATMDAGTDSDANAPKGRGHDPTMPCGRPLGTLPGPTPTAPPAPPTARRSDRCVVAHVIPRVWAHVIPQGVALG
ncbi:hypothetical protein Psuf_039250 [Phytohabitans suffuscus]|uniref:Uncharacterized protein n=1 Tax=Phytohabitans suffuscus TaxID=624315 RepID=A0A6F8YKH2_9ACTN|nr:hypothetical protein Psuf_039250 [Phytohabitans suffuscus]